MKNKYYGIFDKDSQKLLNLSKISNITYLSKYGYNKYENIWLTPEINVAHKVLKGFYNNDSSINSPYLDTEEYSNCVVKLVYLTMEL